MHLIYENRNLLLMSDFGFNLVPLLPGELETKNVFLNHFNFIEMSFHNLILLRDFGPA